MLYANGRPLAPGSDDVEDYATVQLRTDDGTVVRLACSWRISAGRDAVIEASVYGTVGGLALRNVDGSFYDFVAERYTGTKREYLARPPDEWGGRAAIAWVEQLSRDPRFDPEAERLVDLAGVLDAIYGGGAR
jgi:predicted dehydrogenase